MSIVGKKLLIISHTLHTQLGDKKIVGWGPTVTEINFLAPFWNEVVHIACLSAATGDNSLIPYTQENIRFCSIPTFGGKSFKDKFSVFTQAFKIVRVILRELKGATHVQVRVPMGIGVYVLPLFKLLPRKYKFWVKYSNNWEHVSQSLGYKFQRWILKKNLLKCPVTINGFWPNQSIHLKSFENPCITLDQFKIGNRASKNFNGPFKLVFAGRIESAKGIDLLIKAIANLPKNKIREWVFLGDGPMRELLELELMNNSIKTRILGFVNQEHVHKELVDAHFLVLPSKSEGFPKVVAEAWNYGCIPISSAVGSIPHYLENGRNGFLISEFNANGLVNKLNLAFNTTPEKLLEISQNGKKMAQKFTFEHYIDHLIKSVFIDN
jgi:glycosyltransferase involved in cell wall biosynthesis